MERPRAHAGFTFIEVIVTMLVLVTLAAIAIPTLLPKQNRGFDAAAKANAGSFVSHVEWCFTEQQDYRECETGSTHLGDVGLPQGKVVGGVTMEAQGRRGYTVSAYSKSGNVFRVQRDDPLGPQHRGCTVAPAAPDQGGCSARPVGTW